ncbi:MAG: hypothetical protein IJ155_08580 [Prevotella sp.]|nr:hypothetical protein [Prevotella sp.]
MIFCRMDGSTTENNWNNKWNQTGDLDAPATSTPVYMTNDNNYDGAGFDKKSIDESGFTIHKIYVQDKEATGQTPCFYEYENSSWSAIDNAWPGAELTTEIIDGDTWYVFKTLKTSVLGRFMQAWNNSSNWAAGGIEFDLSSSDLYYNYYPSAYQSILTSEALSTPAVLHFRSNNGESVLKHYFWNNTGINDEGFTTTSAGGATDWLTITSYKPAFSIQFYTYDNGGTDTDKTDGLDITGLTGGENYYYFAKLNANNATGDYEYDGKGIMKMQDSYYLVYADGWDFDTEKNNESGNAKQTVGAIQLTANAENGFEFDGALDNTDGKKKYYAIVPASDWSGTAISAWGNLISPSHPASTDSKYTIDSFETDECAAMPTTWTRWYNSAVNTKFDIAFNFATMTWTSTPYIERTINGYATFSSDYAVAIPDDVTAYYATAAETGKVTMTSISNGIPANTGAFLKADNDTYKFTPATSTESTVTPNLLQPSGSSIPATDEDNNKYRYVYAVQSGVSAFYNVGTEITENVSGKAYLETTSSIKPTSGAARIAIVFDDDVTGINSVNRETINNNEYYNLAGQRVAQPAKGLYIVNGKKVIKH